MIQRYKVAQLALYPQWRFTPIDWRLRGSRTCHTQARSSLLQPCHSLLVGARPRLKQKESSRRNLICIPCRLKPLTNCKLVAQVGQQYRCGVRSRYLSKPIAVYHHRPSFKLHSKSPIRYTSSTAASGTLHATSMRLICTKCTPSTGCCSCMSTFVDECMPCPTFKLYDSCG